MIERINMEYFVDKGDEPPSDDNAAASIAICAEAITLQELAYSIKRFLIASGYAIDSVTLSTGANDFSSERY